MCWSDTSSSIWFNCIVSSFSCLSLRLFNVHIRPWHWFYFSYSKLGFCVDVTVCFNWSFSLSKSFIRCWLTILHDFDTIFHFLDWSTCVYPYSWFLLICDCNVFISAIWRLFLFSFSLQCSIIFSWIFLLTLTFFKNFLQSCGFWINLDFLIFSLRRFIIIWWNSLLGSRLASSIRFLCRFSFSRRRSFWSFLRQTSIDFLDHYHFFFDLYWFFFWFEQLFSFKLQRFFYIQKLLLTHAWFLCQHFNLFTQTFYLLFCGFLIFLKLNSYWLFFIFKFDNFLFIMRIDFLTLKSNNLTI